MDVELEISKEEGSRPQSALFLHLSHISQNPRSIFVANTHLKADMDGTTFEERRASQIRYLLDQLQSFVGKKNSKDPILLCGDFNTGCKGDVYSTVTKIPDEKNISEISQKYPLKLKSAYANYGPQGEPEYTLWCKGYAKLLDFIFYSNDSLNPIKILDVQAQNIFPEYLPCKDYPSDHMSILCHFGFK